MNEEEKIVETYLRARGFTDVLYEPDGNTPPDLLVDGQIAVEVRRLNQNHSDGKSVKGLEETAIPAWHRVKEILADFGPTTDGKTWSIFYHFSRPVESWKTLAPKLKSTLESVLTSNINVKTAYEVANNFSIDVTPSSKNTGNKFFLFGNSDQQSGGWLIEEMAANIRHCSDEKERKIAKFRDRYPRWWLALVDHIGYGLDDFDLEMFKDQVSIQHQWEKILIVSPKDPTRWFEI